MRFLLSAILGVAIAWVPACSKSRSDSGNDTTESSGDQPTEPADDAAIATPPAKPDQIVLASVVIKTVDPDSDEVDIMPRELARRVGALLTSKPQFVRTAEEVADNHAAREAKLEIVVTYNVDRRPKQSAILCAVEATLEWADGGEDIAPRESVIAERPLSKKQLSNVKGLVLEHVAATVAVAAQGIADKETLRQAPNEEVVSALAGDDLDAAMWALELIGDRKLSEALDAVIAKLQSKAPEVRDTAIGTLVALGDPRAVDALAAIAEPSDHDLMNMILEAVSAIGGDDAVEYLEFIASGHPDDEIKDRAEEGLQRLRKNPRR